MIDMKKKMSPNSKKAKLTVLNELKKLSSDAMKEDLAGMKKVTVASNSPEGLKKGLEKAEKMIEGKEEKDCSTCPGCPECQKDDDSEGEERSKDSKIGHDELKMMAGMEDEQEDSEPMDIDELEQKIQELMKMKEKLQK
jgi:hypothetical protein